MDTRFSPSQDCCDPDGIPAACIIASASTSVIGDFDQYPDPIGWVLTGDSFAVDSAGHIVHTTLHPDITEDSGRVTANVTFTTDSQTVSLIFDYIDESSCKKATLSIGGGEAIVLAITDQGGGPIYSNTSATGAWEVGDTLTLCVEWSSQGIVATVPSFRIPALFFGAKIIESYTPAGGDQAGLASTGGTGSNVITVAGWSYQHSSLEISSCGECARPIQDCVCCPTQPPSSVLVDFPTVFTDYSGAHWTGVSGCDFSGTYILQPFTACNYNHTTSETLSYTRPFRGVGVCDDWPTGPIDIKGALFIDAVLVDGSGPNEGQCQWVVRFIFTIDIILGGDPPPVTDDCVVAKSRFYYSDWYDHDDPELCGTNEDDVTCTAGDMSETPHNTTPLCIGDYPSTVTITPQQA